MQPQTLAPGVFRIPTAPFSINNAFLVEADDGPTLVDPGMKATAPLLERGLRSLGYAPGDIPRVVITHAHMDHAGAASRVAGDRTVVAAHEDDVASHESGVQPAGDPSQLAARVLGRLPYRYPAVSIGSSLADGDRIGGLRVIHTPGHTPGHISLLHEESGVLLVGDAFINLGFVRYPFSWFCTDLASMRRSAALVADLDFATAAFAHGPPLLDGARDRVRRFLDRH